MNIEQEPVMEEEQMCGGLGGVREKDDNVAQIVEKIKPELEEKSNLKFSSIEVLSFRTQLVAGRNYFVKAKVLTEDQNEKILHLRIYENLTNELSLTAHQLDKTLEDELDYFQ